MSRRFAALALLCSLLAAGLAHAQALATLKVDDVRVDSRGRHRVLVSALDADGAPIPDLAGHFNARLDGQDVGAIASEPASVHQPVHVITVVVDGALLREETLAAVQEALRGLLPAMGERDQFRVVSAGHQLRSRASDKNGAGKLIDGLGSLADSDTPVLYDALYRAARDAARLPADRASALLVVTRGSDGGSDHTQLQVLAMARNRARLTPVMVTLVGDEGAASEADPLQRLCQHSAGAYTRVGSPNDLPSALAAQVDRAFQRYSVQFTAPDFDTKVPRHTVEITVAQGEDTRRAERTYDTAEASTAAWWRSPLPWLILLGLVAIVVVGLLVLRRRQVCLLVHDGGDQDGVWYEVFALPVTLGGAQGNDIVFADHEVSRNHAVLERRGRSIEIADLNSENGSLVNGERITRRILADGDRISLGDTVHLIFEARS